MASPIDSSASKLPFFAWLFLFWMGIAAIAAGQRCIQLVRSGSALFGAGALIVAIVLATGVLLMVARHPRARVYWLCVVGGFIVVSALGLFAPAGRDMAELTLVVMSAWFVYFWRSTRVRATLLGPLPAPAPEDDNSAAPAV